MSALPAATAAWLSLGMASPLIWVERPPLGCCTASALVILPPLTVIRTWTGPYSVVTAVPVRVCAPAATPPCAEGAPRPPACTDPASDAGFSDSSSTMPDTVAAVASRVRRMGWLFFIAPSAPEV